MTLEQRPRNEFSYKPQRGTVDKPDFDKMKYLGTAELKNLAQLGEYAVHTADHKFSPDHYDTHPLGSFDTPLFISIRKGSAPGLNRH